MDKIFHQTVPIIALKFMPKEFQDFMITNTYTISQLQNDAILPDAIDKDNMENDCDIHHAHSYKLQEVENKDGKKYLKWIDGDGLEKLKLIGSDVHDFYKENKLDLVRYSLAKGTHYRIDIITYPHLHRGKPWSLYHEKFENEMGKFLFENQDKIKDIKPNVYADIYKDCRQISIQEWYKGLKVVDIYEKENTLLNHEDICLEICILSTKVICDWWFTLWEKVIK
jgi:hypothetical protein